VTDLAAGITMGLETVSGAGDTGGVGGTNGAIAALSTGRLSAGGLGEEPVVEARPLVLGLLPEGVPDDGLVLRLFRAIPFSFDVRASESIQDDAKLTKWQAKTVDLKSTLIYSSEFSPIWDCGMTFCYKVALDWFSN